MVGQMTSSNRGFASFIDGLSLVRIKPSRGLLKEKIRPNDLSLSREPLQWKFSRIGNGQKRKHVRGDDDDKSSGLLEDSQLQSRKSTSQMNKLAAPL
jgi:hypothetical protein